MNTYIKTAHEEEYSDKSKVLGILVNLDENNNRVGSFPYIYRKEMYIFFKTIIDMADYLLYSSDKVSNTYMTEEDFDEYYDADHIDGLFSDHLKWV